LNKRYPHKFSGIDGHFVFLVVCMALLWILPSISLGQTVGRATGGDPISADSATTSTTAIDGFVPLNGPTIRETSNGQLKNGNTIALEAPSGFEWNTDFTIDDIAKTPVGTKNTKLKIGNLSVSSSVISIEITGESKSSGNGKGGGQGPGSIKFTGLEVRPTSGQLPNSGTITHIGSADLPTNNLGELEMAAGAKTSITIETKPSGSGNEITTQNITAGNSITVYSIARDQFNNYISNINVGENGWQLVNISDGIKQSDLVASSTARNATFNAKLVGSAQIEASDGSGTAIPSNTITVVPSSTDKMVLTQQPQDSVIAGTTINPYPILELRDRFGNKVTDDDSRTIEAEAVEGNGLLNGTKSITPTNGIIEFSDLNIQQTDTTALSFQSTGLSNVSSDEIEIYPANPRDLSYVVQPSNTITGGTISPPVKLQLLDEYGNIVESKNESITISQANNSGNISGSLTASTNSEGVASFANIIVSESSNNDPYQFEATIDNINMANGPVLSNEFLILAEGQLAGFNITAPDGSAIPDQTAGQSFQVTITAVDGNGNPVTDYSNDVVLTSSGNLTQGSGTISGSTFSNGETTVDITDTSAGTNTLSVEKANNSNISGTVDVNIKPASIDETNTEVSANPNSIVANGISSSKITVQLKDQYGNDLITGGENITISTDAGTLIAGNNEGSSVTAVDNNDGTYTADLESSTTVETASLEVFRDDNLIDSSLTVEFTAGELNSFVIKNSNENDIGQQIAGQSFDISVRALDQFGNTVDYTGDLNFNSSVGIDGGQSASISNGVLPSHSVTINEAAENVTITATTPGNNVSGSSNSFKIIAGTPDPATSTVSVAPTIIEINDDGINPTAEASIVIKDSFGNRNYQQQTVSVSIQHSDGSPANATISSVADTSQDGTYEATITSSDQQETVEISATVNSNTISDTATLEIVEPNTWQGDANKGNREPDDWSEPSNWSLDKVPTVDDFVTIPNNPIGGVFPLIDEDINVGTLRLESQADLILPEENNSPVFFTVASDAIINGQWDFQLNTGSEVTIEGNLSGSGSYTADGDQVTNIGGNISINSYTSGDNGAILKLNGDGLQLINGGSLNANKVNVRSDVELRTNVNMFDLDIADGTSMTLTQDASINLLLSNITGTGSLNLNNNTLEVREKIDLASISASDAHVKFIGSKKQLIENIQDVSTLTIDNNSGVRIFATNNLEVTTQLNLLNGSLIIPSGVNLIANNKNITNGSLIARRIIDGSQGWRMLSPPLASTYNDFLDSTVTQGYENSNKGIKDVSGDSLQPNVLYYSEDIQGTDNQRWRSPTDANNNLTAGQGLFVYFFGNISDDDRYNNTLPDTLQIEGQEFEGSSGTFNFPVSYTAEADSGWNFVGNPYVATLDWDSESWTKSNIDNTIYVWDSEANDYLTWNGVDGSLSEGHIAPFQGFWVKANAADPTLTINKSAKTTGGQYYGKSKKKPASIGFKLTVDSLQSEMYVTLSPDGKQSKDPRDAYRLLPFDTDTYLEFYSTLEDGTQLDINNLARSFGKEISIPIHVGGFKSGTPINGEYTISWPDFGNIPDSWTLILEDNKTDKKVNLRKNTFYSFNLSQSKDKAPVANTIKNFHLVQKPQAQAKAKNSSETRFALTIKPGDDAASVPDEYSLGINYPNPFSKQTTIKYNTPVEDKVEILIYDVLGRKVKTILDKRQPAAFHETTWTPTDLASGVYICVMRAGDKQFTKKMTFIK